MRKIISVVNQKGGVGKTTSAINLATALAATKKKILIIDFDPQGNATTGLGITGKTLLHSSYDFIQNQKVPPLNTKIPYLDIIPTNMNLAGAEIELVNDPQRSFKLKQILQTHYLDYQYILIDCPPSLGLLTVNALSASHEVIIPLQCEFFALEGISQLIDTIHHIQNGFNPDLEIRGIILTMYDSRNNLSHMVASDVRNHFGLKVYQTMIPRNVKISEAPSHGLPVMIYDIQSRGAQAYLALAKEFLNQTA